MFSQVSVTGQSWFLSLPLFLITPCCLGMGPLTMMQLASCQRDKQPPTADQHVKFCVLLPTVLGMALSVG